MAVLFLQKIHIHFKSVWVHRRMVTKKFTSLRLSDQDLDFLIEAAAPDVGDKSNLKKIIQKDEDFRNSFIVDICLFILGIYPDYAERSYRYPLSGEIRPQISARTKISPAEYEKKGRQFYRMAAEHPAAVTSDLADIFWALHENFQKAKKPLNFIAEYYLRTKRHNLFE